MTAVANRNVMRTSVALVCAAFNRHERAAAPADLPKHTRAAP